MHTSHQQQSLRPSRQRRSHTPTTPKHSQTKFPTKIHVTSTQLQHHNSNPKSHQTTTRQSSFHQQHSPHNSTILTPIPQRRQSRNRQCPSPTNQKPRTHNRSLPNNTHNSKLNNQQSQQVHSPPSRPHPRHNPNQATQHQSRRNPSHLPQTQRHQSNLNTSRTIRTQQGKTPTRKRTRHTTQRQLKPRLLSNQDHLIDRTTTHTNVAANNRHCPNCPFTDR